MPAEHVEPPKHPIDQLTTSELAAYRRQLEHAIGGIAPDAPVQALLHRNLDAVRAEQDDRKRLARA
jgi:hypothetical protein